MNIAPKIEIIDLALLIDKRILIVSDFHIGYEQHLHRKGILIPKFQLKDTILRLEKILNQTGSLDKIIINGDLKHEFHTITNQEWSDITKLVDFLRRKCKELIIIQGNHDKIIIPIAEKKKVTLIKEYREPGLLVTHGDIIPDKLETVIVIGHEHPAVSLRNEGRSERFKCFLKGHFKRKTLIVLPSFNLLTEGTDITKSKPFSPFLQRKISNFNVYIVGDDVYDFGKLRKLEES